MGRGSVSVVKVATKGVKEGKGEEGRGGEEEGGCASSLLGTSKNNTILFFSFPKSHKHDANSSHSLTVPTLTAHTHHTASVCKKATSHHDECVCVSCVSCA